MPLDSFADPADLQVQSKRDNEDVKPQLTRDEFFYFDTVVFQVEMTLFRVPRRGFEVEGSLFQTLFSLPSPMENGEHMEGRDDRFPIVLGGITKEYFQSFLRVMYPFDDMTPTFNDWLGALDLATMWDFAKIRNRSIEALSTFLNDRPTTAKIILGKKYHVKAWLVAGYTTLVTQDQLDLNQLPASSIDWPTISRLFAIRETMLRSRMTKSTPHACTWCGHECYWALSSPTATDVEDHIARNFALELNDC